MRTEARPGGNSHFVPFTALPVDAPAFSPRGTLVLPFETSDQSRVRSAAHIAEAATRACEAAESAQSGHVVNAIGVREFDALVRIIEIPAHFELCALPQRPAFGQRRL